MAIDRLVGSQILHQARQMNFGLVAAIITLWDYVLQLATISAEFIHLIQMHPDFHQIFHIVLYN